MIDVLQKRKELEEKLHSDSKNGLLWLDYGDLISEEFVEPRLALEAYIKAQELLPNKDFSLRIGYAYYELGESSKAIEIIELSNNSNPRPHAYCYLADIFLKTGNIIKARESCLSAICIEPNYEEAYFLLGESWLGQSDEQAILYYKKAIEIDPEYSLAYRAIGQLYVKNSITRKQGIEFLNKSLKYNHSDGWTMIFLAYSYWKEGNSDLADQFYKMSIEVFPDFSELYKWYSEFLFAIGRINESKKVLNQIDKDTVK